MDRLWGPSCGSTPRPHPTFGETVDSVTSPPFTLRLRLGPEVRPSPLDCEASLPEQLSKLKNELDIAATVATLPTGALLRLQPGKLRLPIPQNVGLHPRDSSDLADPEEDLVRDLDGLFGRGRHGECLV